MSTELPRLPHKLRNDIRDLRRSSTRDSRAQYVAEGPHLAADIVRSSITPAIVVLRDDADNDIRELAERMRGAGAETYACGEKDMDLMTDATSPQSILCVMPYHPERPLGDRALVLDAVSDPGNVGTMIRTAAWFGFTDVVLGLGCADLYNPKTMRSTAGAALTINVIRKKKLDQWLLSLDDRPRFAAVPRGGDDPSVLADTERFVILIGSEAHGIAPSIAKNCTREITIPGNDGVESLNAAIAASILCYEGRRT